MTQSNPFAEDLKFVRQAVEARDQPRKPSDASQIIWTLYCLVCIPAYDYAPHWGGTINLIGWLSAMVVSMIFGKLEAKRRGQFDAALLRRAMLHWYGGVALLFIATTGMALVDPGIGSIGTGQMSIILVGFLYYTAGVNFAENRFMIWAGPVIVVAGIGLTYVPHLRWTLMGLIFAMCLMSPVIARRLSQSVSQPDAAQSAA